jgi:tetratricopeptide (TPR) repeat protein
VVDKLPADADRLQKKVWEVAGPPKTLGRLEPQLVDEERRRELDALGYVSSGRRTIMIDMSGPDPKDRVAILGVLEQAADEMNHDHWSAAAPRLARIMREDPSNPLIYQQLQLCYERLGRFGDMEQVCLQAIRNGADSDETYSKLGEISLRRGDLPKAVELMERAAKINPANLTNMTNLATALLQLGRADEAGRVLQAILAQNPRYGGAHNVLGLLDAQQGRATQAREHLEKAVEFNPELTEAYLNLGIVAQKTGDVKRAVECYRDFLKRADPQKHRDAIPKVKAALAELGAAP